ncbi:ferredoxin--NADP(+) reductase, partial [Escherichia coli]|nr:ferredoxin--NADP(+) reductase [Escherichia coli]
SSIAIKTPFIPTEVLGNGDKLTHITLQEGKGDTRETLEIDDFIINYGFVSSLGPIKNWGLELERNSIVVNSKME